MYPINSQPNQLQFNLEDVPSSANMAVRQQRPSAVIVRMRTTSSPQKTPKPNIVIKEVLNTPLSPSQKRPYSPIIRPTSSIPDDPTFQFTAVDPEKLSTAIVLAQRNLKRMEFEEKMRMLGLDPQESLTNSQEDVGKPRSKSVTSKQPENKGKVNKSSRALSYGGSVNKRPKGRPVREKPRNKVVVDSSVQTPSIHSKVTQTNKSKGLQVDPRTDLAFHASEFDMLPAFGSSPPTRDGDHYVPTPSKQARHAEEIRFLRRKIKQYVEEMARLESRMIESEEVKLRGLRKGDQVDWYDDDDPVRKARRLKERHMRSTRMLYFLQKQVRDIQNELRRTRDSPVKHTKKSQATAKLAAAHRGAARAIQTFLQYLPDQFNRDAMPTMYTDLVMLIKELSVCCAQLDIAGAGLNDELMRTIMPTVASINDSWIDDKSRVLSPYLRRLLERQSDLRGPRDEPPPKKELFPEFDSRINPVARDRMQGPCFCYPRSVVMDDYADRDLTGYKYRKIVRNKGVQVKRPTAVLKKPRKKPWVRNWTRKGWGFSYQPPPVHERLRLRRAFSKQTKRHRAMMKAKQAASQFSAKYNAPTMASKMKQRSLPPRYEQRPNEQSQVVRPVSLTPTKQSGTPPSPQEAWSERESVRASPAGSGRGVMHLPGSPVDVQNYREQLERVNQAEMASTVEQLRMEFDKRTERLLRNAEKVINDKLRPVLTKAQDIVDQEAALYRQDHQSLRRQLSNQMADKVEVNADVISEMLLEDLLSDTVHEFNRIDNDMFTEQQAQQMVQRPAGDAILHRIGDMQNELDALANKYSTARYTALRESGYSMTVPELNYVSPCWPIDPSCPRLKEWSNGRSTFRSPLYPRRINTNTCADKFLSTAHKLRRPLFPEGPREHKKRSVKLSTTAEEVERKPSVCESVERSLTKNDIVNIPISITPASGIIFDMCEKTSRPIRTVRSEVMASPPPEEAPRKIRASDHEMVPSIEKKDIPSVSNVSLRAQRFAYDSPASSFSKSNPMAIQKTRKSPASSLLSSSDRSPSTMVKSWFDRRSNRNNLGMGQESALSNNHRLAESLSDATNKRRTLARAASSSPMVAQIEPMLRGEIDAYCEQFEHYLKKSGHWIVGKFDPWKLAELISDELVDECVQEISEELDSIQADIVNNLYKAEFKTPTHSAETSMVDSVSSSSPSHMAKRYGLGTTLNLTDQALTPNVGREHQSLSRNNSNATDGGILLKKATNITILTHTSNRPDLVKSQPEGPGQSNIVFHKARPTQQELLNEPHDSHSRNSSNLQKYSNSHENGNKLEKSEESENKDISELANYVPTIPSGNDASGTITHGSRDKSASAHHSNHDNNIPSSITHDRHDNSASADHSRCDNDVPGPITHGSHDNSASAHHSKRDYVSGPITHGSHDNSASTHHSSRHTSTSASHISAPTNHSNHDNSLSTDHSSQSIKTDNSYSSNFSP